MVFLANNLWKTTRFDKIIQRIYNIIRFGNMRFWGLYMNVFILSVSLGLALAVVTGLLFVSFDGIVLKILLYLIDFGFGGFVPMFCRQFDITDKDEKILSVAVFYLAFIIFFLLSLYVLSKLIKDKNHPDSLRIRDILLNRRKNILEYIEWRKKQIDEGLNIPDLEERERKVSDREAIVQTKERNLSIVEENINDAKRDLAEIGKKKLKMVLPEKKDIYIKQDFIDEMPSFFDSFSNCVMSMNHYVAGVVEDLKNQADNADICIEKLRAVLIYLETDILSTLFGNSSQVRVHFRKYNPETGIFEKVSAVAGEGGDPKFVSALTPIPYENSMIQKSFECRRAVIKSINADATLYDGDNHSIWQDYMTFAFFNICLDNLPCLSFGISVKNKEHYRKMFMFLSYAKFEMYLKGNLEKINELVNIPTLLDRL